MVSLVQILESRHTKLAKHTKGKHHKEENEAIPENSKEKSNKEEEAANTSAHIIQKLIAELSQAFKVASGGTNMNRNIDLHMKPGKNLVISEQYSQNPGNSTNCINFVNIQVTIVQNSSEPLFTENGNLTEIMGVALNNDTETTVSTAATPATQVNTPPPK